MGLFIFVENMYDIFSGNKQRRIDLNIKNEIIKRENEEFQEWLKNASNDEKYNYFLKQWTKNYDHELYYLRESYKGILSGLTFKTFKQELDIKYQKSKIELKEKYNQIETILSDDKIKYHQIYKVKNIKTNEFYIGRTKNNLSVRKNQHKKSALQDKKNNRFYIAIREYGWENFKWETIKILEDVSDKEANEIELRYIDTLKPHYNLEGTNNK